jgi:hypothetical protein
MISGNGAKTSYCLGGCEAHLQDRASGAARTA